jgi:hypothetical protein
VAPLTFQQQWMWSTPDRQSTVIIGLRISGELDAEVLRQSFEGVVRRHGALRTRVIAVDGVPQQRIDEAAGFAPEIISLDTLSASESEERARRFVERFFYQQIHRDVGKQFEVRLLRLSVREHVLVLSIRHIIADAFSLDILFRELWALYGELVRGRPSPLRNPPAQYANYAHWQRKTDQVWVQKHATYWEQLLARAVPVRLPLHPDPKTVRNRGDASVPIHFDAQLSAGVRGLARRARVLSPAIVMLTVYVAALSRWCDQREFVLPFTVAGRHLPEHGEMIGFLSYYLYLSMTLTGDETFLDLLLKVSRAFYTALEHQDFGRISTQAPELLLGTAFNWAPGALDRLVGLPTPAAQCKLADLFTVEPFTLKRSQSPRDHKEEHVGIAASVLFYESQDGFSGTLYYQPRVAPMTQFARALHSSTQRFIQNPGTLVATAFGD